MKPYGFRRRDSLTCQMGRRDSGCCTGHKVAQKYTLDRRGPRTDTLDRAARKRERQQARKDDGEVS